MQTSNYERLFGYDRLFYLRGHTWIKQETNLQKLQENHQQHLIYFEEIKL